MNNLPQTSRTTLKRLPKRGSHDREVINQILDEGFICHVGFVVDGQPIIIPTGYARIEDKLIIHGSQASHMLRALEKGSDGSREMARYERKVYRAMRVYWKMVYGFYTTPFIELFMSPRDKFNLPSAVTALLAGELEGGWKIRWRMRLFFWIVGIHSRWPMLPKISFDETPAKLTDAPPCHASSPVAQPAVK